MCDDLFPSFDFPVVLRWIKIILYLIASIGIALGVLSAFSPKRSIKLYQIMMQSFNWRVEPINWIREIRNTKWFGYLMAILSFLIFVILLTGCAHEAEPWGYRLMTNAQKIKPKFEIGTNDKILGVLSKDKVEMLRRYGVPKYVSSFDLEDKQSSRLVKEWVYLNPPKRCYFFDDNGELLDEDELMPLDTASFNGYLEAGMNPEQVKRVKGEPDFIESANLDYGASEKWVYRKNDSSTESLYFSNGLLFSWGDQDRELRPWR